MLKNKFNMTQEQNVFLAKRNIVDTIWKSALLEGIPITFPETQTIYDGGNIAHLGIDQLQIINNLKHAWKFCIMTINDNINLNYISSIHSLIGTNLVESPVMILDVLKLFLNALNISNNAPMSIPVIENIRNKYA